MAKPVKVFLILLGVWGIAFLAWFLLQPEPQALLRTAQARLMAADFVRYSVDVASTGDLQAAGFASGATGTATVKATSVTDADFRRPAARATRSTFTIDIDAGVKQSLAGESILKEGTHYLKLSRLTGMADADAGMVGKWISSPRSYLKGLLATGTETGAQPPTPAQVVEMKNAVSNVDLFEVLETMKSEKIDGKKMRRFKVRLNAEAIAALIIKWHELKTGLVAKPEDAIAAMLEVTGYGETTGTVWIGASDKRFRRIVLATDGQGSNGVRASVTLDFTRYGEPVDVQAPAAEPAADVIGSSEDGGNGLGLSGTRSATSATAAPEAPKPADGKKDADGDGLGDSDEFLYNSDPWNPDTDGDGYDDGTEVKSGKNPTGPGALFGFGL